MENHSLPVAELLQRIESYSKTSYEITKLKSMKATIMVASSFAVYFCVAATIFISLGITCIGIALLFGDLFGKTYFGFFFVAGVLMLAAFITAMFLFKKLKGMIIQSLLKQMMAW